ncbi:TPA: hypothetical protein ACQNVN_001670 [Streptococcus pyogenes]
MSYKKDLESAKTFDDCQNAYDKECERRFKRYEKQYGSEVAFTRMIACDFGIRSKANDRLLELFPGQLHWFDFEDWISPNY